ncbi:hypothetical protein [Candidatus Ichthyocystis sparus]|uniref:hypothetical protein n=1 Tax=Candidatus Ichthyocystis sparus TaxID=1561004 RepID=UPI000B892E9A|nr:hypothetical protein [Candidatus Ichthyocystis sparus]
MFICLCESGTDSVSVYDVESSELVDDSSALLEQILINVILNLKLHLMNMSLIKKDMTNVDLINMEFISVDMGTICLVVIGMVTALGRMDTGMVMLIMALMKMGTISMVESMKGVVTMKMDLMSKDMMRTVLTEIEMDYTKEEGQRRRDIRWD